MNTSHSLTNIKADSTKVGFDNGRVSSSPLQLYLHLRPGSSSCLSIVLKHLQTKPRNHMISWIIPHNTSFLLFSPVHQVPSIPPTKTTCWFKWAALRPPRLLGKNYSSGDWTMSTFKKPNCPKKDENMYENYKIHKRNCFKNTLKMEKSCSLPGTGGGGEGGGGLRGVRRRWSVEILIGFS